MNTHLQNILQQAYNLLCSLLNLLYLRALFYEVYSVDWQGIYFIIISNVSFMVAM